MLKDGEPVFHHRTPVFEDCLPVSLQRLKQLFLTGCMCCTGSRPERGAMETAVVNILRKATRL